MLVNKTIKVMDTVQELTDTLSKNEISPIQQNNIQKLIQNHHSTVTNVHPNGHRPKKPSQNHQRPINHSEGRGEPVGNRQGPASRHGGQDEHVHDHQGPVNHPGIQNPGFPDQHRSLENTKPGAPVILITMMTSLVDWGPKNSHLPVHIVHTDQPGTHYDCQCRHEICQVTQHDFHVDRARHVPMDQIGWTANYASFLN